MEQASCLLLVQAGCLSHKLKNSFEIDSKSSSVEKSKKVSPNSSTWALDRCLNLRSPLKLNSTEGALLVLSHGVERSHVGHSDEFRSSQFEDCEDCMRFID